MSLPLIMVAPNGARRTKQDHPALPITAQETVTAVLNAQKAGAQAAHLHLRDEKGGHILDAALYRDLLVEMGHAAPEMLCQITTEAVGQYSADDQQSMLHDLCPRYASVALREISDGISLHQLSGFYHWAADAGVHLQHILYAPDEVTRLIELVQMGVLPAPNLELLFVLGRYGDDHHSSPADMDPFLTACAGLDPPFGWSLCAFGPQETACLAQAIAQGGKARVGFENNLYNSDGTLARDNADRVRDLLDVLRQRALV